MIERRPEGQQSEGVEPVRAEPHAAAGYLLRSANRLRALERMLREAPPRADAALRIWFLRPIKRLGVAAGLFAVTVAAALISPRVLYVPEGTMTYADRDERSPFVDYRIMLVSLFAVMDALAVNIDGHEPTPQLSEDELSGLWSFLAQQVKIVAVALTTAIYLAIGVWLCARFARVRIRFGRAMQVAGYAYVSLVIAACLGVTGGFVVLTALNASSALPLEGLVVLALLAALVFFYWVIRITFVIPVLALSPGTRQRTAWVGWLLGWALLTGPTLVLSLIIGLAPTP